jgi:hypothetical protein
MNFSEEQNDALGRLEATMRRRAIRHMAIPAPSGKLTLFRSAYDLPLTPPDPPTLRDLGGPLVQD